MKFVVDKKHLRPIRRRFETVFNGKGIQIVSDYAHHPTEIAAVIQTAAELKPKRVLGVFQPHCYTRTLALGPDFPSSFEGLEKLWLLPTGLRRLGTAVPRWHHERLDPALSGGVDRSSSRLPGHGTGLGLHSIRTARG